MLAKFGNGDWRERLDRVVAMMRELSLQTEPQAMVRAYSRRVREAVPVDRFLAASRRELPEPKYRITRSSQWQREVNPWHEKDRLPVFEGGLLGELIYSNQPRLIQDLRVGDDDPAAFYLRGMGSLLAVPNFDQGVALNLTVLMREPPGAFDPEEVPEYVWMSNLFGRATHNLVLNEQLHEAYRVVDRELRIVADIQRSLLPKTMPTIRNLDLAAHYQTSQWAGGDYYDFFPLPDGRWGLMIADVAGHGTPAAVMMAITHSLAHSFPGPPDPPGRMLTYLNDVLSRRYTAEGETFVTAFYAIYDPESRTLNYANAGHNPPRLKRCEDGSIASLEDARALPLGVFPGMEYGEATFELHRGDQVIFYTDGITEAVNPEGRMFGLERLDQALENCFLDAEGLIQTVLDALRAFTGDTPATDDRTMLVAKVS